MSTSYQRLVVTYSGTTNDFKSVCDLSMGGLPATNNFVDFMSSLTGGNQMALCHYKIGAVKSTGTITFVSFVANDTFTLAGITVTAKTSGATGAQFNIGGSPTDTTTAAAAAAFINSYASFSGVVTATSALGVVTLSGAVPGTIGNAIGIVISAHGSVSGALMTSGSDGTAYNIDLR